MFEFGKRDGALPPQDSNNAQKGESRSDALSLGLQATVRPVSNPMKRQNSEPAVIGPSIRIEGELYGEEDLIIEGQVKGRVQLENNVVTIGSDGKVEANVYSQTILVEGAVEGDLYASERVSINQSARVRGNITAPRVKLEDGAQFKGSIEMDPKAVQSAFESQSKASGRPWEAAPGKPNPQQGGQQSGQQGGGGPQGGQQGKIPHENKAAAGS